jgi:hypothetical protein
MVKIKSESETTRHKKLRIVLWILFPLLLIPNIIASYFYSENSSLLMISAILVFFALIDLIIIFSISRKYYNWLLVLLLIFIVEMIMSWFHLPSPPGNVPFIIGIISILCSIRIIKSFDNNSFIRWFGFFSNYYRDFYGGFLAINIDYARKYFQFFHLFRKLIIHHFNSWNCIYSS